MNWLSRLCQFDQNTTKYGWLLWFWLKAVNIFRNTNDIIMTFQVQVKTVPFPSSPALKWSVSAGFDPEQTEADNAALTYFQISTDCGDVCQLEIIFNMTKKSEVGRTCKPTVLYTRLTVCDTTVDVKL